MDKDKYMGSICHEAIDDAFDEYKRMLKLYIDSTMLHDNQQWEQKEVLSADKNKASSFYSNYLLSERVRV